MWIFLAVVVIDVQCPVVFAVFDQESYRRIGLCGILHRLMQYRHRELASVDRDDLRVGREAAFERRRVEVNVDDIAAIVRALKLREYERSMILRTSSLVFHQADLSSV